ncbi:MAG: hypothetical protein FWC94_05895 [Bacteroidales bacterium]|nr:hypothetical protein [Bacteroidales bacterium]
MKKILKISLLFFAAMLIIVGCRKERDASLVNIWVGESVEIREIRLGLITIPAPPELSEYMSQIINPQVAGTILELREDRIAVILPPALITLPPLEFIYTANGNTLTIGSVEGRYNISRNQLNWDVNLTNLLTDIFGIGLGDLGIPDIPGVNLNQAAITARIIFNKK